MLLRTTLSLLLALPLLAACASSDPVDPGDATEASDLAAGSSVSAHVPGMTVWVEPQAVADWRYEQWVWVLRGRASKNLASAFSYSSDDEFGETSIGRASATDRTRARPATRRGWESGPSGPTRGRGGRPS